MAQENNQGSVITPSQYFEFIKDSKHTITTETLKNSYEPFIKLAEKYNKLGQVELMKKLCFLADVLLKEEKLIELGINTFVYKDVIEDYITNVADKAVKIIELSRYMREIPDELIETVEKSKELFDQLYVVFTDYTGKEERKVEKERRDKDPILFGVFKNGFTVSDRFYFLGDWVDEYCDLTLDKMIEQYKDKKGVSPALTTKIPESTEELVELLKSYNINATKETSVKLSSNQDILISNHTYLPEKNVKKGFISKVRSIFKKQ
ncbi:MAG: hypothetical protein IJM43_08085 [Bacteroidaceae bacterium]|nr:hypothetical protein [Bacteroidaceae bacterium]